jgi:hypothetical protein
MRGLYKRSKKRYGGAMLLALAKFEPAAFSRFSKAFGAVEIELQSAFQWSLRDRTRFSTWILKKGIRVIPRVNLRTDRTPEELEELIGSSIQEWGTAIHHFTIASGRKRFDRDWERPGPKSFFKIASRMEVRFSLEWGEEDTPLTTASLRERVPGCGFTVDPDHHRKYLPKVEGPLHFKLHGWHPERWVRRYGEVRIRKILRSLTPHPEAGLTLAHSGRVEEAPLFAKGEE